MSNPSQPIIPPVIGESADAADAQDADVQAAEGLEPDPAIRDDDRPLDPDLDDDQLDSAEADARAATEGTMDGDADART